MSIDMYSADGIADPGSGRAPAAAGGTDYNAPQLAYLTVIMYVPASKGAKCDVSLMIHHPVSYSMILNASEDHR